MGVGHRTVAINTDLTYSQYSFHYQRKCILLTVEIEQAHLLANYSILHYTEPNVLRLTTSFLSTKGL